MSQATGQDIAAALVTSLNAASFTQSVTAVRRYRPHFEIKELTTIRLSVIAMTVEAVRMARGVTEFEYGIDVALQKAEDPDNETALDALAVLAEEIDDHIREAGAMAAGSWLRQTTPALWIPEHLHEKGAYTHVSRHVYHLEKEDP